MLTYIKINGFKSFQNFEMAFTPLTVIAGVNASGKSNLFDALQLLARLAETDLKTAFSEQRGNPNELFTQYGEDLYEDEMSFIVEMLVNRKVKDNWGGEADLNNTRLRYQLSIARTINELGIQTLTITNESLEKIIPDGDEWIKQISRKSKNLWKTLKAGGSKEPFIKTETEGNKKAIKIRQDGGQGGRATPANAVSQTVLGGINSIDFRHAFAAKEEMRNWKFLQLNPEDLRAPTRQDVGLRDTISHSGKNLAAALFRIKQTDSYSLKEISRKLNTFLPNFTDVDVLDDKANAQYLVKLRGEEGKYFSSRVLSEGTLRLLALCILEFDEKHTGLLCFEEPENGIHPFRIAAMAKLLKDLSSDLSNDEIPLRQVIVNTHSPVLIGKLIQWENDLNVSVWLCTQHAYIDSFKNKKYKIRVTRSNPVIKKTDNGQQLFLFSSEHENKLTLNEVKKILESMDEEKAIKSLEG